MPDFRPRNAFLAALALTSAALLAAPAVAQMPPPPPMLQGTRLVLTVEGTVTRVPDIAMIGAGVVTQANSAAAAMADNARRMDATLASLRAAGVAARDIQTSTLSLSPRYVYDDNQPPRIAGYQASNQVTVRFRDLAKAGTILDALVAAGANQIDGPNLSVDKPEAALDEARTQAIATARQRADLYARAAGLSVKRIVEISESGAIEPQRPMPMFAMAKRAGAAADTAIEPGEQKLGVNLAVTFELQ
jgi:uncharacterized protein YggE